MERGRPLPENRKIKTFATFVNRFVFKLFNVFNLSHNAYCIAVTINEC